VSLWPASPIVAGQAWLLTAGLEGGTQTRELCICAPLQRPEVRMAHLLHKLEPDWICAEYDGVLLNEPTRGWSMLHWSPPEELPFSMCRVLLRSPRAH
jgi:hypothetical protein